MLLLEENDGRRVKMDFFLVGSSSPFLPLLLKLSFFLSAGRPPLGAGAAAGASGVGTVHSNDSPASTPVGGTTLTRRPSLRVSLSDCPRL